MFKVEIYVNKEKTTYKYLICTVSVSRILVTQS